MGGCNAISDIRKVRSNGQYSLFKTSDVFAIFHIMVRCFTSLMFSQFIRSYTIARLNNTRLYILKFV